MTVAFDAATVSTEWTGTTPDTETHTPVGTPKGVVIFSMNASATDSITGASYGALTLTEVPGSIAIDASGETGLVKAYFAGSSIPAGAQSCTVTQSGGNGVTRRFYVVTLTGADDLEVVDTQLVQDNIADPAVTLDSGSRTAIGILALHSGSPSSGIAVTSGLTSDFETAFATDARTHNLGHETTPTTGSRALGWTVASDDVALVGLAISEVVAAGGGGATVVRSLSSMGSLRSLVSL
jgi:hypothetical protein